MKTPAEIQIILKEAECLYSASEINEALDRMAVEITNQIKDKNPLILCVMTGALITTGHLATRLHFPLEMDYIHATRIADHTRR